LLRVRGILQIAAMHVREWLRIIGITPNRRGHADIYSVPPIGQDAMSSQASVTFSISAMVY